MIPLFNSALIQSKFTIFSLLLVNSWKEEDQEFLRCKNRKLFLSHFSYAELLTSRSMIQNCFYNSSITACPSKLATFIPLYFKWSYKLNIIVDGPDNRQPSIDDSSINLPLLNDIAGDRKAKMQTLTETSYLPLYRKKHRKTSETQCFSGSLSWSTRCGVRLACRASTTSARTARCLTNNSMSWWWTCSVLRSRISSSRASATSTWKQY